MSENEVQGTEEVLTPEVQETPVEVGSDPAEANVCDSCQ
jgi:hypothetical protein